MYKEFAYSPSSRDSNLNKSCSTAPKGCDINIGDFGVLKRVSKVPNKFLYDNPLAPVAADPEATKTFAGTDISLSTGM